MQQVFIGDVQGCADEFEEMLERAERAFGEHFELWLVGDLVNRGPENLRALRRVRALVEAGVGVTEGKGCSMVGTPAACGIQFMLLLSAFLMLGARRRN